MKTLRRIFVFLVFCCILTLTLLGGNALLAHFMATASPAPVLTQQPQTVPTAAANPELWANWSGIEIPNLENTYFIQRLEPDLQLLCAGIYQSIMEFEEEIKLPEPVPDKTLSDMMWLLSYDCPELFQISGDYSYFVPENDPGVVLSIKPSYIMSKEEYQAALADVQALLEGWLHAASGNELAVERMLYENVINTCTYNEEGPHAGSVYGALILGEARCEGYAKAMCMVLRAAGMESLILTGEARTTASNEEPRVEKHAWNVVKVNGSYCQLDPTWDDSDGALPFNTCYAYFNLTDEEIYRSRSNDAIYQQWEIPSCTDSSLSWHKQNGSFIPFEQELGEAVTALLENAYQNERNDVVGQFETQLQLDAFTEHLDTWISNWYRSKKFSRGSYQWVTYADSRVFTIFNLYYE